MTLKTCGKEPSKEALEGQLRSLSSFEGRDPRSTTWKQLRPCYKAELCLFTPRRTETRESPESQHKVSTRTLAREFLRHATMASLDRSEISNCLRHGRHAIPCCHFVSPCLDRRERADLKVPSSKTGISILAWLRGVQTSRDIQIRKSRVLVPLPHWLVGH